MLLSEIVNFPILNFTYKFNNFFLIVPIKPYRHKYC